MALGIYEEEDIRAVAKEIRDWAQTDKTYTVKQMVQGVGEVASAAHADGYLGGHTAGLEEGKAIGYEEGQNKGYELGRADGVTEGRQAQYDEFWDNIFGSPKDGSFMFAGACWDDKTFYPPKNIRPIGSCHNMFAVCGITDLVGRLSELGVALDMSGITDRCDNMFGYCYRLTTVPYLDTTYASSNNLYGMFHSDYNLHTIEGIKLKDDGSQNLESAFVFCYSLENLTIEGTIGQNGFNVQWSTKLSKASWISIINALSETTSGLSITGSLESVNTAFETSAGAKDGSTSAEWLNLIATKSNWTVNLV